MRIFGYASTFNDIDDHKDVVCNGAFKNTLLNWKEKNSFPLMLYDHRIKIGYFNKIQENDIGLFVEGKIDGYNLSRKISNEIKNKNIQFFSIGFKPIKYNKHFNNPFKNRIHRTLNEIDLIEVSVVKTPANNNAKIMF